MSKNSLRFPESAIKDGRLGTSTVCEARRTNELSGRGIEHSAAESIPASPAPRTISFTVGGHPVAKGRPRASRTPTGVRMRTPEKTATYERKVRSEATNAMSGDKPGVRPVRLKVSIVVPIPASWSKVRKEKARTGEICATKKPDADNVLKAIKDAMNGVVYVDDSQVVDINLSKAYGDEPRVEVAVTEIDKEAA